MYNCVYQKVQTKLICLSKYLGTVLHAPYSECHEWMDNCLHLCLLLLHVHPGVPGKCISTSYMQSANKDWLYKSVVNGFIECYQC